jgi:GT2 family glycosyltransferase
MDVSVIIVNYNTFALTCDCIRSVYAYTDFKVEVILVDNASSECDPDEFQLKFPAITLVKSASNVGFARGNNLGIARANGEFVLLLNSDALLTNNAIVRCKEFLKTHSDVAVVSGRLKYPDGKIQHNCQRFPTIRYKLYELFRLQKIFSRRAGPTLFGFYFDYQTTAFPDWIWGTFFMFKRKLLQELPNHKLADDFFMYGEDMQWCMEFKRRGYRVAFEPAAEITHIMGGSGASKSAMIKKNHDLFMQQYYTWFERAIISFLDKLL